MYAFPVDQLHGVKISNTAKKLIKVRMCQLMRKTSIMFEKYCHKSLRGVTKRNRHDEELSYIIYRYKKSFKERRYKLRTCQSKIFERFCKTLDFTEYFSFRKSLIIFNWNIIHCERLCARKIYIN